MTDLAAKLLQARPHPNPTHYRILVKIVGIMLRGVHMQASPNVAALMVRYGIVIDQPVWVNVALYQGLQRLCEHWPLRLTLLEER